MKRAPQLWENIWSALKPWRTGLGEVHTPGSSQNLFCGVKGQVRRARPLGPRGDTLVEVLLSISILGLVLVLSFTSANRSLSAGTDAANRNQALSYAREQVELLRDAANNGTISNYPTDTAFCIDPSDGSSKPATSSICQNISQSQFDVSVRYNAGNLAYHVVSQWQGRTSQQEVFLYYQVPLGPITALPGGPGGGGVPPSAPVINFKATPSSVAGGGSTTLSWSASGASDCHPSAGPADWLTDPDRKTTSSFDTGPINTDTTFTITCDSDSAGGPSSQSSVAVPIMAAPSVTLDASPSSIEYYQGTTLSWKVSGASSCSASSNSTWSGPIAPSDGSVFIDHLSSGSKNFTLSCTNAYGVKSASKTVFVNNNPGFCIDINFGGVCTYFNSSVSNLDSYGLNDKVSSVLVPPGRREILYKDANDKGTCYIANSNVSDMRSTAIGNDELSSFINGTGAAGC